jgi:hypothetical protein
MIDDDAYSLTTFICLLFMALLILRAFLPRPGRGRIQGTAPSSRAYIWFRAPFVTIAIATFIIMFTIVVVPWYVRQHHEFTHVVLTTWFVVALTALNTEITVGHIKSRGGRLSFWNWLDAICLWALFSCVLFIFLLHCGKLLRDAHPKLWQLMVWKLGL